MQKYKQLYIDSINTIGNHRDGPVTIKTNNTYNSKYATNNIMNQ